MGDTDADEKATPQARPELVPVRIDDLITAAARSPYRYGDEWVSRDNPEHLFALSDLRKVLHDLTDLHGGEWAYDRAYDRETIYYRYPASTDWLKAWHRIPDRD